MAVVIIVTEAIKQEASQVAFIPMQQGGYVGLRVLFTDKSGRQKEFDSVPHTVRMPLVNSMKAWAGIPYWAKSPSPATIPLRCDAKDYWMTISIVRTDLGESVSVAFAPKP